MDNDCSIDLKEDMKKYTMQFKMDPPYMHRRSTAERAIITCKNNLIYGLSTTDPDFPMREWDPLVPQCFITLNLLPSSRFIPDLSAYA